MATYTIISSATVGAGGQAAIDFTSIPQTYTDLAVRYSTKYTGVGANTMRITFNNNSSGYTYRTAEQSGSSSASFTVSSAAYGYGGYVNGTSGTALTFTTNEIYIPNYAGSNNKSFSSDYILPNNSTSNVYEIMIAQLWANTSAITSVKLIPESNLFAEYTTAYLYGISNA
jgi:hypothetical protein